MNKARDNQIVRDIIDYRISELYCIKEGYYEKYHGLENKHTLGKKYAVFSEPKNSMRNYRRLKTNWWDDEEIYESPAQTIYIKDDNENRVLLVKDSAISEYFEVEYSLKKIRKEKIKRLRSYEQY